MEISLKAARINSGLTQQEAANYLNVSVQTLRKYEKDSTSITFNTLNKMSKLYSMPIAYFCIGSNTNKIVLNGNKKKEV